jgi:phosphoribosyl 1,2-cyclic phosphodiesterase
MSFSVRFWGTRGSIPSPGPHTVRYGGNTPCVEVRTPDGHLIVLDAGTGIRDLGRSLLSRSNGTPLVGDVFISHPHWDHVQGLPFFSPAFRVGHRFTIWVPGEPLTDVERVIRDQMSPAVFPISFEELSATIEFRRLDNGGQRGGDYDVQTIPVSHPGGALGYRFASRGAATPALVYISDNELGALDGGEDGHAYRELTAFARGARILVHDATYTEAEYASHRGWGHSTDSEAVQFALAAGVETLVLFHHAPARTDEEIDRMVERCVRLAGDRLRVIAAAEALELRAYRGSDPGGRPRRLTPISRRHPDQSRDRDVDWQRERDDLAVHLIESGTRLDQKRANRNNNDCAGQKTDNGTDTRCS